MITTPVKQWRRQKNFHSLLGKKGVIEQWSIIRVAAKGFAKEAPYPLVIVVFDDNTKMIGQLVDWIPEDVVNGRKVITILRRSVPDNEESLISYCIKFKPYDND